MKHTINKALRFWIRLCTWLWNAMFVFVAVVLLTNVQANNFVLGWDWTKDPIEHWIAIGVALLLMNANMGRREPTPSSATGGESDDN